MIFFKKNYLLSDFGRVEDFDKLIRITLAV